MYFPFVNFAVTVASKFSVTWSFSTFAKLNVWTVCRVSSRNTTAILSVVPIVTASPSWSFRSKRSTIENVSPSYHRSTPLSILGLG